MSRGFWIGILWLLITSVCHATLASAVAAWEVAHPGAKFAGYIGDSTVAGYPNYDPGYPSWVPSGDEQANVATKVYENSGNLAAGQNRGVSGAVASFCTLSVNGVLTFTPKYVFLQIGINDMQAGRVWNDVVASYNSIRTSCINAGAILIVCEVWPATLASAAAINTYNTALRAWAASNSVPVVLTHDWMADPLDLDDLNPAYTADGTHANVAGVNQFSQILVSKLEELENNKTAGISGTATLSGKATLQ